MDWAERVANLHQWRRGGERAPHKPLLLLYALAQYQRHGDQSILYSEAEKRLSDLLSEFGPPRKSSPAYPFHHLTTDGLWTVTTATGTGSPGASPTALRGQHAAGRLTPDLARSLDQQPRLLPQLARIILDTNFEPTLHDDICAQVGLDLEQIESELTPASHADAKRRRDPEFRRAVLVAYESRCAFCGYDGTIDRTSAGLEAAHVRWWTHDGPDEIANGLCLCSIHHKLFDRGVLGITDRHRITVSVHFVGRSQAAEQLVLSLANREVIPPQTTYPAVAPPHATWHAREVFRSPARAA